MVIYSMSYGLLLTTSHGTLLWANDASTIPHDMSIINFDSVESAETLVKAAAVKDAVFLPVKCVSGHLTKGILMGNGFSGIGDFAEQYAADGDIVHH